jgi:uncharacterized protein (TIGR02118 family)
MKVLFVLFKRAGLAHEQCMSEWSGERHVSTVKKTPGLTRWVQNHVTTAPGAGSPDGIGELWFDDAGAMESKEMAAAVEDAKRFLDMDKSYAVVVEERRILG